MIAWVWLFGRAIRRLGARAKLERDTPEGWLPVAMAAALAGFVGLHVVLRRLLVHPRRLSSCIS